jgi:hypothetical protein
LLWLRNGRARSWHCNFDCCCHLHCYIVHSIVAATIFHSLTHTRDTIASFASLLLPLGSAHLWLWIQAVAGSRHHRWTHRALHAEHSLYHHSLTPDSPFTCSSLLACLLNRMPQLSLVGAVQRGAGAPSTAEHPPPAAASGRPRRRDHVHATAA